MKIHSFTELTVYKKCRQLRQEVSKLMRRFLPAEEKYRLLDQVIRYSRSVTANVAEGHGRHYFKDNARFCRNARDSLVETHEHYLTALDEDYILEEVYASFLNIYSDCLRLLNGYIRYLRKAKPGAELD